MERAIAGTTAKNPDDAYDEWRAKDDMRTILEAARIQKNPARMKNVRRCAKEQLSELKSMQALAGSN